MHHDGEPTLAISVGEPAGIGPDIWKASVKVFDNAVKKVVKKGNLTSLKRFKDDVNEVKSGFECGIGVAGFYDFQENDVIEVYAKKEVKRTLK